MRASHVLVVGLLLVACQPAGQAFSDSDYLAIEEGVHAHAAAALASDWESWADLFTADAVFMIPAGGTLEGRQAIREFGDGFPTLSVFSVDISEVVGRRDLAFSRGAYYLEATLSDGSGIRETGKFIWIWREQADGSWRLSHDIWNSDPNEPVEP